MSEWVSVKDRMPDFNGTVLVIINDRVEMCAHNNHNPAMPTLPGDSWPRGFYHKGQHRSDIQFWMPLPEPPRQSMGE